MVHKVPGHSTLLCNLKKDRKDTEVDVKRICIDAVTGWKRLTPDDITVRRRGACGEPQVRPALGRGVPTCAHTAPQVDEISGGITNLLWKLTPKLESGLSPVVARVFGEQTDLLIDRAREKEVVLQLNQAGFGAPVSTPALSCLPALTQLQTRGEPHHAASRSPCWHTCTTAQCPLQSAGGTARVGPRCCACIKGAPSRRCQCWACLKIETLTNT